MPRQRREGPWLEKHRDNGTFYVFWYDAERGITKRKSLKTDDRAAALKKFGEFVLSGPPDSRGDDALTVRQALAEYLREHVYAVDDKKRPRVVDTDRQKTIAGHLTAQFGDAPLETIGPIESRVYAATRRKAGVTDSTIRRELVCLVAAFNHGVKWKRLPNNSRATVELPLEERGNEVEWLTKEQMGWALARSDGAFHDWLVILYYTGARRRSIENLTKRQVDLQNGRIDLMSTVSVIDSKRRMTTKRTKKRRPTVPIYPEMRAAVERRMAEEGDFLFPHYSHYARWFTWMMADLGIKAHPHMIRHSRASHMLQDGESLFKVAKLLGDTVKTVESVYGHSDPEFLKTDSGVSNA